MRPEPVPAPLAARLDAEPRLAGWMRLEYFPEIGSTNDRALALASDGAPAGTAVLADTQSTGRGRRGRNWHSPPGAGLYVSVVLRPGAATVRLLTLTAGVALAQAVEAATGLPVQLKWPNDLVIGRPWRKLAGILAETSGLGAAIAAVVVGIGVNVSPASRPPALISTATDLESELGRPVDRDAVLVELLARLRTAVARLEAGETAWVVEAWRHFGRAGLGGAVRWTDAGGERRGIARDIADDGALVVQAPGGETRVVAGEVVWERMS